MIKQAALGDVVFSSHDDFAYDELTRVSDGGWVNVDRADRPALSQAVGRGLEKITISGDLVGADGQKNLRRLRDLQAKQLPQTFINGAGEIVGQFKLMQVTERQRRVIDDGTSLVTSFTVELEQYFSD